MIHPDILSTMGNTPLIRINRLNPNPSVKILAKMEYFNPGGSVKDRVALAMIEAAEKSGELTPDKIVIEATSGNTGIGLAMVCAVKGYKLKLLMPSTASEERKKIMAAFGAELHLTPGKLSTDGAIEEAYRLAREEPEKYVLMDQFNNEACIEAHYATTAQEMWDATDGTLTHAVVALGTSGTAMGVTKKLKELNPEIACIAVEPKPGHKIQGLKNMHASYPPGIYDKKIPDRIESIEDEEAFDTVRKLATHEGLFAGMSSGAAMAVALRIAEQLTEGTIVVLLPDGGDRYLSTPLFESQARQGVGLFNEATEDIVRISAGPQGCGLFTMGPPLDNPGELDGWRRIVLNDVLAGYLESKDIKAASVVGLADLDDRALEAASAAMMSREDFVRSTLKSIEAYAERLNIGPRTMFRTSQGSIDTVINICKTLLTKGAAYEKLRSVYFDVLRFDNYGRLGRMDLSKISHGRTVDLADYVKDNPKDFTLLKRASLKDLKTGDCLQTEWGNVRPSWFLQLAATALDHLSRVTVFTAAETHRFPHLDNFRAIWSLGRDMEPEAWLLCRSVAADAEDTVRDLGAEMLAETAPGALRMWLLSASYRKPLAMSEETLTMWRKNWAKVQNTAAGLRLSAGPEDEAKPEPRVGEMINDLSESFRDAMENDVSLHHFWPALFTFTREAGRLRKEKLLSPADSRACLNTVKEIDSVLGILDDKALPLNRNDWPQEAADLVLRREQARAEKNFTAADDLRAQLNLQGFRVEDTKDGSVLYRQ